MSGNAASRDECDLTEGLPSDLARVLRDQSIVVPQDTKVWELLASWQNAPSNTASADLLIHPDTAHESEANAANRHKAVWLDSIGDAPSVVYRLMMEMDKHEDLDEHPIRQSEAYNDAVRGLGWDIDWEAVRNAGP